MLDQSPKARSMGHHQHLLAGAHLRNDRIGPLGHDPLHRSLERFREREVLLGNVSKLGVVPDGTVVRVVRLDRRWRNVEAAAPHLHLRFTVNVRHLALVEPGQGAVVALVQPPQLVHRDVAEIQLAPDHVQRLVGPPEARREGHIEGDVFALQRGGRYLQRVPFTWK